jgi:hypothetical protein
VTTTKAASATASDASLPKVHFRFMLIFSIPRYPFETYEL